MLKEFSFVSLNAASLLSLALCIIVNVKECVICDEYFLLAVHILIHGAIIFLSLTNFYVLRYLSINLLKRKQPD